RADEVHVEGDQRPAGADDRAARGGIEPARAEVGRELAVVDPSLELLRPAAPEERRASARADLAVEEDRQLELGTEPARKRERRGFRTLHVRRLDRHDRDDVGGADSRVDAAVAP